MLDTQVKQGEMFKALPKRLHRRCGFCYVFKECGLSHESQKKNDLPGKQLLMFEDGLSMESQVFPAKLDRNRLALEKGFKNKEIAKMQLKSTTDRRHRVQCSISRL